MNTATDTRLTPREVADYLQIKPQTLAYWRMERRGPSYRKIGKRVEYRQSEVEEWLDRQKVTTND